MTPRSWRKWVVLVVALALVVPMASVGYAEPPFVSARPYAPYTAGPVVRELPSAPYTAVDGTGRAVGFWEAVEKASKPSAPFTTVDGTGRALGFWKAVEEASK